MTNRIAKLTLVLLASLPLDEVAAQTFKCKDAAGKITYSGKKCSELGLKDAGEVKDRLNVNPAYTPPAAPSRESRRSSSPAAQAPEKVTPAAAPEPPAPERRCFTVQTAKGSVTRCNDKPGE